MIRHTVAKLGTSAAVLAVALSASAFRHPDHEELPNLDKRRPEEAAFQATEAKAELARGLARRVKGLKIHFDPLSGVPRWVGSTEDFLTGPKGAGKGVTAASAARFSASDPHRAVKSFVHEHAALFGHGVEELERARVERDFVAPHSGLRTVVWQQELEGIPVFNARFVGHVTTKGELVNVASQFVPDLDGAAARRLRPRATLLDAPPLSAAQAIGLAGRNVGETAEAATLTARGQPEGAAKRQKFSGGNLIGESEARLTWFPLSPHELRLAWDVTVTRRRGGEMFRVLVDAETGEVLARHCLTAYLTNATYNVFTSDSPSPFSPGHATPMTSQPPLVSRTLVTLSALNTNASPNGWIDDDVNETRGNNVDAHLDRNADDQPDLPRPQGSPFRVLDFPMDFAQPPTEANNQNAAVVQLFYWCNWYHDKLYELGFTEAAGNYQNNNFGRGGLGNDAVLADAQDGTGFNNANFGTSTDGSPGRMQMYLFSGPNPDRDGDLDAEIIIHEHTHGLSNRRVGNGALITALQTSGMGEGWSDFYALALLAEPGDALDGNFALAGYATHQFSGLSENYYYGIRRYPYSTNLNKNPLTFKDIDVAQEGAHPGIPRSPVIGGAASEVHNQGEVWCVALWEVRGNLVAKYGFATGNQLALQLVTDGMGLTPANPNFLEARDGILQADLVLNGGANRNEIWAGFAKRGMGFSATSPSSSTTAGVVEAFDLPDDLHISPGAGLIAGGPVGGPFNPGGRNYLLANDGSNDLAWAAGTSTNWLTLSTSGGTLPVGGAATSLIVSLNSTALALPAGVYTNRVQFTNLANGRVQTRVFAVAIGQPDLYTEIFDALDNDLSFQTLRFTPDGSASFYGVCRNLASSFPTDPAGGNVVGLSDDSFVPVTLAGGAQVPYHGTNYNKLFIGSNGYLTFGSGDTSFAESISAHFNRRRISGLFVDLDPPKGGTISWKQLPDRIAVTWQAIREYATARENSFQIELFFNGRVTITHLAIATQHGLAGLSRGVAPALFIESDLSAYSLCVPTLTLSAPAMTREGDGVLTNQGVLMLDWPVGTNLIVSLQSTDTNEFIVPSPVTIPAGQTSNLFNLTVVDDAVVDGPKIAQILAASPGFASASVTLTNNDNEAVTLSLMAPPATYENAGVLVNQGMVHASLPPVNNVIISLTSSNPAKIQVPPSVVLQAGQTSAVFSLTVLDNLITDGTVPVGLSASVDGWTNGSTSVAVFDDETSYPALDHFQFSAISPSQSVATPFEISLTAMTASNSVVSNFFGTVALRGLRYADHLPPVKVHSFEAYTSSESPLSNTKAAIATGTTDFILTTTMETDPFLLQAELADKHVFLISEQSATAMSSINALGATWSSMLRDFVSRGGIVIVVSAKYNEYLLLANNGLMDLSTNSITAAENVTSSTAHPLTEGVASLFSVDTFRTYDTANAQPVIQRTADSKPVVAVRDFGLGHTVLIGASYATSSPNLDRILANAIGWARSSRHFSVETSPNISPSFLFGAWSGAVSVLQPASDMFFLAYDSNGRFGVSTPFAALLPPQASNLSFTIQCDTFTNLPLWGYAPNGGVLTYLITRMPTNGVLSTPPLSTNLAGYTPVHGFTGYDEFVYRVSDGTLISTPALVSVTTIATLDSDGDGIPDVWEIAHGLNPTVNDAGKDPDGDGLTNLQEYLADTDPQNSTSGSLAPQVQPLSSGHYLLTWRSVGGVRYRVQYSDGDTDGNFDGAFTDLVRPAASEIDPALPGAPSLNSFTDDFTHTGGMPAHGNRYYRVNIIR